MDPQFVVETQGLSKRYGRVTAVRDLSLAIPRGGVFGLLGPNGSGKTTTMGMLLGLIRPTSGTFRLLGNPGAVPGVLKRVGATIEAPAFYPYLSGRDNLRFFQGLTGKGALGDIEALLARVRLEGRARSRYATYSFGMKQRLAIAYALLGDPEVVFLDEPTNGLDPAGVAEVREFIADFGRDGRTVVLSSHILHEVEMVCDHVAILVKGTIVAHGAVRDLLRRKEAVRVATTDDAAAMAVLKGLPWVERVESTVDGLVADAPAARSAEISRALASANIYLRRLEPLETSLEQYFLEVTATSPAGAGTAGDGKDRPK
jgi:ABC-2 type transport system ATP-binding protein